MKKKIKEEQSSVDINLGTLLVGFLSQSSYRNFLSGVSVLIVNMEELSRMDNTDIVWALLIFQTFVFSIMFLITKQTQQH